MSTFHKTGPTVRLKLFAIALLQLLFLAPTEAHALTISCEMDPASLPSGITMKAENLKDGMIEFTITRDFSKAPSFPPEPDLQIVRSATLQVFGKSGLLAKCDIEPSEQKTTITYRFVIARDCVPDSSFTLAEFDAFKDRTKAYIGDGWKYEFRLALFAESSSSDKAP